MPEKKSFDENKLSKDDLKSFRFVKDRILQLQEARKDHYGIDLDKLFMEADRDYVPHRLKTKSKKVGYIDDEKGWRGSTVKLGSTDWQSDVSQSNVYVKVQVALALLIDQNPTGVFTATSKKFQATTELIKQLYQRTWEHAKSKAQLKLFVFNMAKYGWAIARTYPLRLARKTRVLTEYNAEDPSKSVYEEKEVIEYNDVMRENLDVRNTWIDDMARPNNDLSLRDWAWRKVYDFDVAEEEFGKWPNWKFVQKGGTVTETIDAKGKEKKFNTDNLVEIYFYENKVKDLFMVIANGVPVIIEPLPIADSKGNKKLSCWQAYWNLRHSESPYGIGIYESIRYDNGLLDRIRNMTIDQLTLSIYKMFFYSSTQSLNETGDISIAPGVGKQTLNPKDINFLEVPGPGNEAWTGLEMFKKDVDEVSGIGDPLLGEITGKTAFELAQAKESALKRLKNPLDNVLEALNAEGYITISLIQLIYSIPETFEISDPQLIQDYMEEIQNDPELFEGDPASGQITAKVYPEFPLNMSEDEKDEKGNLIETKNTRFFRIKPESLYWEGIINIKAQSLLTPSKQVDKSLELEMYNLLIPLLQPQPDPMTGQDSKPGIYAKVAKNIVKLYDKDPRDILPDEWLLDPKELKDQQNPLIVPAEQAMQQTGQSVPGPAPMPSGGAPSAPTMIPSVQGPANPQSIVGKISANNSAPFRV